MAETPREFWDRVGLGQTTAGKRKPPPKRTRINVVMWETCINRHVRGYSFPAHVDDDGIGTSYGPASVVRGEPGKAAVSAVWYDERKLKMRSRYLGQFGKDFQERCDEYAAEHPEQCKPAFVVAVDSDGSVLYSVDLCTGG